MRAPLPAGTSVIVYVRDSTDQQGEEEIPLEGQVSELTLAAGQYGWAVYDVIRDIGTGSNDKREGFQRVIALSKVRPRPFDAIFVWKLSRFARNRDDSVIYKALLRKRGVRIISHKENLPEGPIGRLIEGVIEAVDEFYTANVAEDTLRGLKEVARQGYHPGGRAPVGYRFERSIVGTKRTGDALMRTRLVPDELSAPKVLRAFEMAAEGRTFDQIISACDICVNKSSLSTILRNEVYVGVRIYNRERQEGTKSIRRRNQREDVVRVEDSHQPIVSKELFDAVQSRLRSYVTPAARQRRRHPPRLLSGLIRCALHDQPFTVTTTYRTYYLCRLRSRRGKAGCDNRLLRADEIEAAVVDRVAQQLARPENLDLIFKVVKDEVASQQGRINDGLLNIQRQESRIQRLIENLVDAIAEGTPAGLLSQRIKSYQDELMELRRQRTSLMSDRPKSIISVSRRDVVDALKKLDSVLSSPDSVEARALVQALIDKIVVSDDAVTIYYGFRDDDISEADYVAQHWLPGQDSNLQPSG